MNKCRVVSDTRAKSVRKKEASFFASSISCTIASSGISCGTGGNFSKVMSVFSHQAYH